MTDIFLKFLEASMYGSIMIAVILILRFILKKAPRATLCLLWLLVGLRLLMPFSIESRFSLQPARPSASIIQWEHEEINIPGISADPVVISPPEEISDPVISPPSESPFPNFNNIPPQKSTLSWAQMLPIFWISGILILGLHSFISYLKLIRRVSVAKRSSEGYWECGAIDTAFVLGLGNPQIYVPIGLSPVSRAFILSHEQAHIDRGDHWWKLLGFGVLSLHWFNPLVWLAFHLFCKDIEMACDERVVRHMNVDQRKAYSAALLSCSSRHTHLAYPVAFGEVSVRQRILGVLRYRRPGFWISVTAAAAVLFVLVCFLTNPASASDSPADDIPLDDYVLENTTIVTNLEGATKEDSLLAKCFNALSAFQNQESYSAIIISEFNTSDILNSRSYQEFWCSGEDWLRISEIPDAKLTNQHLYANGHLYNRVEDGYSEEISGWSEAHNADPDAFRPWIEQFRWNANVISLSQHSQEQGTEYITLTVAQELTMSGFTVPSFTLTFEFVGEDTLAAISLRMESEEENPAMNPVRESIYISVQPRTHSQEESADLIQSYYLSTVDSVTETPPTELDGTNQSAEKEFSQTGELSIIGKLVIFDDSFYEEGYVDELFHHTEGTIVDAAINELTPYWDAGLLPTSPELTICNVQPMVFFDQEQPDIRFAVWFVDFSFGNDPNTKILTVIDDETDAILEIGCNAPGTVKLDDPAVALQSAISLYQANTSSLDLSELQIVPLDVGEPAENIAYVLGETPFGSAIYLRFAVSEAGCSIQVFHG